MKKKKYDGVRIPLTRVRGPNIRVPKVHTHKPVVHKPLAHKPVAHRQILPSKTDTLLVKKHAIDIKKVLHIPKQAMKKTSKVIQKAKHLLNVSSEVKRRKVNILIQNLKYYLEIKMVKL